MALRRMVQRAESDWDRMMGSFTQTAANQPRGNRIGSTAARINTALRTRYTAPTGGGVNKAALAALAKAKALYAPGGGFGTGVESAIERGRVKAEASGMQGLVSAGLAGTTMAGTLGKKYQEEVAMPARLSIEEERAQAISGIEMAEAGMGFQAGEAGLQRGFQAGESAAGRDLQRYIADMQARLQREQMAFRAPAGVSTGGGYAQQFPSIYGRSTRPSPNLTAGDDFGFDETPWPEPSRLPEVTPEELSGAFPMGGPVSPTGFAPYGRRTTPTIEEPSPWALNIDQWGY